jgi:hypothetical protein
MKTSRRGIFGLFGALVAAPVVAHLPVPPAAAIEPIAPPVARPRVIRVKMDVKAIRDRNVLLTPTDYAGRPIVNWRSVPIEIV